MDLLFYATDTEDSGKSLWNLFQDIDDKHNGEFYFSIDDLSARLRWPKDDYTIAVLLAASHKDLEDILSVRELLDRTRIILILPDHDNNTIKKGHSLFPRFLTYVDSNFDWVAAVLEKMISNSNGNNKSGS